MHAVCVLVDFSIFTCQNVPSKYSSATLYCLRLFKSYRFKSRIMRNAGIQCPRSIRGKAVRLRICGCLELKCFCVDVPADAVAVTAAAAAVAVVAVAASLLTAGRHF